MKQYLQFFLNKVQKESKHPGKGVVTAFTSAVSGEGVSYVTESFGVQLARRLGKRILVADARRLGQVDILHYNSIARHCFPTDVPNLWTLPPDESDAANDERLLRTRDDSSVKNAFSNLQTLRFAFDYVLLDCPALMVSEEASFLIPATDGVVIVVEADRTKREQIQNAQKTVEITEGNLLGCILNKRQYSVPGWLYDRL